MSPLVSDDNELSIFYHYCFINPPLANSLHNFYWGFMLVPDLVFIYQHIERQKKSNDRYTQDVFGSTNEANFNGSVVSSSPCILRPDRPDVQWAAWQLISVQETNTPLHPAPAFVTRRIDYGQPIVSSTLSQESPLLSIRICIEKCILDI